jgi:hypothetical protein
MTTSPSPNAFAWTHFAGFDWACEIHQVVVVDQTGRLAAELRFADDAQGWQQFRERLATLGEVAVAVETSRGAVVERLLEAGLAVYPVQPKAAERYRPAASRTIGSTPGVSPMPCEPMATLGGD